MRVLVACEYSGRVREAFRALGHDAWSCDLLSAEDNSRFHYCGDMFDITHEEWDLMIAHPPCTFLCNSGERWLKDNPRRRQDRKDAVAFVKAIWGAPISRIAIENPIGHLSTAWRKPDQIIQPFHFGDPEFKTTCLWLKNLPPILPIIAGSVVEPDQTRDKKGRISSRLHRLPPGPDRWKERSRTYQGIADAMASQWGDL